MNVKLLRKVRDHIKKEPKRFQYGWVWKGKAKCGTAACIGGWAFILGQNLDPKEVRDQYMSHALTDLPQIAQRLLRITDQQANRLFVHWPEQFNDDDPKDAVKRIDWFIKTKGSE